MMMVTMIHRSSLWLLLWMALIFHLVSAAGLDRTVPTPTCIASRDPGASSSSSSSSSWIFYDCHVRTLNLDFTTVASSPATTTTTSSLKQQQSFQDAERTRGIRIECNDKLLFESFLASNQTLFRFPNLRTVEIKSCKIRRIPGLLWTRLPLLRSLSIRTQNSHWSSSVTLELDPGALDGLGQLETLDLSENNLWSVADRALCPLRSLAKLNISRNRLSELEELIFHNNSTSSSSSCAQNKLVSVDLSHNSLRHIVRVTPGWSSVRELRLESNLIEQIEDSALSDLRELRLVNLSSNRLVALPPSIFQNNPSLRELYLANNSISALSPAVFRPLEQLVVLDLSRNMLTSQWVRERMFHGLIRLVILRLSFNHLTTLDSSIFKDLISLQALYVDNNRVETIRPDAFALLANLHALDLSYNRLTTISSRLFSNMPVLQQLYLDHNKMRALDENALRNCTALQDLGLAGNLFQEVPVALRGLGLLRSLDIGENRIVSVWNDSFSGLSQLYGLRMVDNRLTELPPGFCVPLKKLRVLNLAQNRLERISNSALGGCPQLRALRLDSNALTELPALTPQLPSLLWLNVSWNGLKTADYRQLPLSLEWLDLSHNTLQNFGSAGVPSRLPTAGSNNPPPPTAYHLRVLDLSHNNLTRVESGMMPTSLETIRMNYNGLSSVAEDTFSKAGRLRRVELVGNQLQVFPLTAIKLPNGRNSKSSNLPPGGGRRSTAAEFYLGGNPFRCDCTMEWLTRVNHHHLHPLQAVLLQQQQQYPRVVDLDAISCTDPRSGAVIPLNEASADHFLCSYESHCGEGCNCCDFDACDCAMRCPDNCTCQHDLTWSRNLVRCSSSLQENGVPEHLPMNGTEIYLDGNKVGQLGSHAFIGKTAVRVLFLNDSRIEFIRNKTFNGLRSLEILRLEDNSLKALHGYEFADLGNLRELYLQNNLLGFIAPHTFGNLKLLRDLRLDGNQLVSLPSPPELFSRNVRLSRLLLSGNPWSCDCEFISPLRSFISQRSALLVSDFGSVMCHLKEGREADEQQEGEQLQQQLVSSLCQASDLNYYENEILNGNNNIAPLLSSATGSGVAGGNLLPSPLDGLRTAVSTNGESGSGTELLWTLTLSAVAILMLILLLVLIFRREIYHRLNDRLNLFAPCTNYLCGVCSGKKSCPAGASGHDSHRRSTPTTTMDDSEKLFDAYFLYSKRDEEMVLEKIAPELEHRHHHGQQHEDYRLCLHYRDLCLSAGSPWNPEMVLSACDASKRIVLVLSRTLLHGEWTNMDFRNSIQAAISRHQRKFIVILLPSLNQTQQTWESFTATCPLLKNLSPRLTGSKKQPPACLQWTDEDFWRKLKQLFPPPTVRISTLGRHNCLHNTHNPHHLHHHHHHHLHHHDAIALPPIPSSSSQQPPDLAPFPILRGNTTTTMILHSKKLPPSYPLPNLPSKLAASDPENPSSRRHPFAPAPPATPLVSKSHDDHFYSTLLHEFPSQDKKQPQNSATSPDIVIASSTSLSPVRVTPPPPPVSTAGNDNAARRTSTAAVNNDSHSAISNPTPSCNNSQMNLTSANNPTTLNNSINQNSVCNCRAPAPPGGRNNGVNNNVDMSARSPSSARPSRQQHQPSHQCQTDKIRDTQVDSITNGCSSMVHRENDSTNLHVTDSSNGGTQAALPAANGPTYFV